jgi:[ribosomal protein S5]-alanine N-acetyltransferase
MAARRADTLDSWLRLPDSSGMPESLETARLNLAPVHPSDAERIQAIFPQWEVVRYLASAVPWPYPADGAQAFCREAFAAGERGEGWTWTIRLRTEPDQIIGVIELMTDPDNNRGFWLAPPWHGLGLATEACHTVTDYWFDVLNFPLLRAWKAVANEPPGESRNGKAGGWSALRTATTCRDDYQRSYGNHR